MLKKIILSKNLRIQIILRIIIDSSLMFRDYYENYKESCEEIEEKSRYRSYPMAYSILSDFREEDLREMMDLGVKYSGEGSYMDPAETVADPTMSHYYVRDFCEGFRNHSISNSVATSWASATIIAAEAVLQQSGTYKKLSYKYLYHCLLRTMEIRPNDVSPYDIMRFVSENGLKIEEPNEDLSNLEEFCAFSDSNYRFEVDQNDLPNKSGLKNFIAEGNPVIVLMALDLVRLRTANSVTGNDIYTGAASQPSLYGVMRGFDEEKWTVTFNVVPCENIEMNLPITESDTNANYAGIAGYAFSLKMKN